MIVITQVESLRPDPVVGLIRQQINAEERPQIAEQRERHQQLNPAGKGDEPARQRGKHENTVFILVVATATGLNARLMPFGNI